MDLIPDSAICCGKKREPQFPHLLMGETSVASEGIGRTECSYGCEAPTGHTAAWDRCSPSQVSRCRAISLQRAGVGLGGDLIHTLHGIYCNPGCLTSRVCKQVEGTVVHLSLYPQRFSHSTSHAPPNSSEMCVQ